MTDDGLDDLFVRVHADLKPFRDQLANIGRGPESRAVTVPVKMDRSAVERTVADIKSRVDSLRSKLIPIGVKDDASRTLGSLRRELNTLEANHRTIRMKINSGTSAAELASLRSQLAAINARVVSVRVAMKDRTATASLASFKSRLASVPRMINTTITARTSGASGAIARIKSQIAGLTGKTINIRVNQQRVGNAVAGAANFIPGGGGVGGMAMRGIGGAMAGASGAAMIPLAAGAGVAAAGAGYGKVVTDGLGSLGQLKQYEKVLQAVTRDAVKANKVMEDLKALNIELPTVGLSTLADAAVKLVGSGFNPETVAEDVRTILDAAATSTAGLQDGVNRIGLVLSQIKSKGKLQAEELLQFNELGLPAGAILSRQFGGRRVDDIAKDTQEGRLDVDVVIRALLDGIKEERGGALESQSQLLSAQMNRLGESYTRLSMTIAEPIFDPLTESFRLLADAMDGDRVTGFAAGMKEVSSLLGDIIARTNDLAGANDDVIGDKEPRKDRRFMTSAELEADDREQRIQKEIERVERANNLKDGNALPTGLSTVLTTTTGIPVGDLQRLLGSYLEASGETKEDVRARMDRTIAGEESQKRNTIENLRARRVRAMADVSAVEAGPAGERSEQRDERLKTLSAARESLTMIEAELKELAGEIPKTKLEHALNDVADVLNQFRSKVETPVADTIAAGATTITGGITGAMGWLGGAVRDGRIAGEAADEEARIAEKAADKEARAAKVAELESQLFGGETTESKRLRQEAIDAATKADEKQGAVNDDLRWADELENQIREETLDDESPEGIKKTKSLIRDLRKGATQMQADVDGLNSQADALNKQADDEEKGMIARQTEFLRGQGVNAEFTPERDKDGNLTGIGFDSSPINQERQALERFSASGATSSIQASLDSRFNNGLDQKQLQASEKTNVFLDTITEMVREIRDNNADGGARFGA